MPVPDPDPAPDLSDPLVPPFDGPTDPPPVPLPEPSEPPPDDPPFDPLSTLPSPDPPDELEPDDPDGCEPDGPFSGFGDAPPALPDAGGLVDRIGFATSPPDTPVQISRKISPVRGFSTISRLPSVRSARMRTLPSQVVSVDIPVKPCWDSCAMTSSAKVAAKAQVANGTITLIRPNNSLRRCMMSPGLGRSLNGVIRDPPGSGKGRWQIAVLLG